ncbi:MAG: dihydromethanopterin reductase (acceptor) [Candidatus Methanomethylicia archaeon]
MFIPIAWGITGAGHYLRETFDVMKRIMETNKFKITTYLSSAGVQVVKIYGLWDVLKKISNGGYLQEIFVETDGGSFPYIGRFFRGVYKVLIVSPATANTVAKIVLGIADTIVTNAVAQAQKSGIPIFIVPTDYCEGVIETTLPYRIERSECRLCEKCFVIEVCPYSAVKFLSGFPHIDLALCRGCGLCVNKCPFNAVKYGEKRGFKVRRIDFENVERLKGMEGITVLNNPHQIEDEILKLL